MSNASKPRTRKPSFGHRGPDPRPPNPLLPVHEVEAAKRKRSTAVTIGGVGIGLLALYGFGSHRSCGPEPDQWDPNYARLKQEYDQCRQRRRSSSSSNWSHTSGSSGSSGTATKSLASRGGFGSHGSGGG